MVTGPCTCAGGLAGKRSLSHLLQAETASSSVVKMHNYDESYEANGTTADDPLGSCAPDTADIVNTLSREVMLVL